MYYAPHSSAKASDSAFNVYIVRLINVCNILLLLLFLLCIPYTNALINYQLINAIFGKIGRLASEEVILQLTVSKCMPMLLFGREACTLNKSQLSSLDFTINRFFTKLFQTNSTELVRACQKSFGFEVPSVLLKKERKTRDVFSCVKFMFIYNMW